MEIYQPEEENTPKQDNTSQATVDMLMRRAYEKKHSSFQLLCSQEAYKVADRYRKQSKSIAKSFIRAKKALLKEYIRRSKEGQDPLELLVSYTGIDTVINFYIEEEYIAKDMMDEYAAYLRSGHILDTLLDINRCEEDMWDHRHDKPNN